LNQPPFGPRGTFCENYRLLLPTARILVKSKTLKPSAAGRRSRLEKNLAKNFFHYYIPSGNRHVRHLPAQEGKVIGEIRYSRDHVWVRTDDDIRATLGVTDYLQEKLGEIYSIRLPEEGEEILKEEVFSSVEARNGRRDLIAPISGEVIEVNYEALEVPEIINEDPLAEGWLLKVEMPSGQEFDDLLTEEEYEDFLSEAEEEGEED
jgi:glycine cleavage system H protein